MKTNFKILMMLVVFCSITAYLSTNLLKETRKVEQTLKEHLGEEVVINGDTLVITDYSVFSDTYILSNGIQIKSSMVE